MRSSLGRGRGLQGGLFGVRQWRYSTVVVQSLSHQLYSQRVRHTARFLQLGTLVLEPDLDLRLVQTEFGGQSLSAVLGQVAAGVELSS